MAFSSPNHMSHGEVYSVTNASGAWVDSSGELARLLPYMAQYRETKVNAWTITPQSGSTVTAGDTMTVTCEDPDVTIWYSRYGEESETQYAGPVEIDTSSSWCIYNVTFKKNGDAIVSTTVSYTVDQSQADAVAKIGETYYASLAAAVAVATASQAESVEISLLKSSSDDVTLDSKTTVTETAAGLYTGTLSGSGTLVLSGTRSSFLSFGEWTGTVVLPPDLASIGKDFHFNYYGKEGSTVQLSSNVSGWIQREDTSQPAVINPAIEIPAGKKLTISGFSPSFRYLVRALKGYGELAITFNGDLPINNADYSPYFRIGDVSEFKGRLSTAKPTLVLGTMTLPAKPATGTTEESYARRFLVFAPVVAHDDWAAPNGIALADTAATLTVEDGVTVSAVSTTIPGYGVVRNGNVYSVERVTNTDYPVPYSWFSGYGISEAFDSPEGKAANGKNSWWECYVLGLDPTNALSKFTATIRMDGTTPIVEFSPTNEVLKTSGEIEYVLQGKPTLTNGWQDVEFNEPGDTNRFFRVRVKWQP